MVSERQIHSPSTRCGFVALIGAPNVGKSTLVNALVGSKVTIVSRKVQTTRALIRGIAIEGKSQIILVDTPGIFAPKRRLDRAMVSTAWSGAHDADLVCVLLDPKSGLDDEADGILAKAAGVAHDKLLVLNKIDLVPREKLLALAQAANERLKFMQTFMISALSGDGVGDRCRMRRCASLRPRSHGRRFSGSCTRNYPTSRRSRPTHGPSATTSRCGSSRPSL
jgi:GTP-binding protein Era